VLQRFAAAVRWSENLRAAAVYRGMNKCCSARPCCSAVLQPSAVVRNKCSSALLQPSAGMRNRPRMLQQAIAVEMGAQALQSMLFSHTYML